MDDPSLEGWIDGVRSAMGAPRLSRPDAQRRPAADWKFLVGDALLAIPAEHRDEVAALAALARNDARTYTRVAEAWPVAYRRTQASWTVYRELARQPARFELIRDGLTLRGAAEILGKDPVDRKSLHRLTDDEVIEEFARIMLSGRSRTVMPRLFEILNRTKEGRQAARVKRSTALLRQLHKEVRDAQDGRKHAKPAQARHLDARRRLLELRIYTEHVAAMFAHPEDRDAVTEEQWLDTADLLGAVADEAGRAAHLLRATIGALDVEVVDGELWLVPELAAGDFDDDDIVDAEIVGED